MGNISKWFICICNYLASNITYTRTGKNINNVEEALNDLYNQKNDLDQTDATAEDIKVGKKTYTTNGLIVYSRFL